MLPLTMFLGLTLISIVCCWFSVLANEHRSGNSGPFQLSAHLTMGFALILSDKVTIMPGYRWLQVLPSINPDLQPFVALIVTAISCMLLMILLPLLTILLFAFLRDGVHPTLSHLNSSRRR